jgi:hypothetical protein
MEVIVEQLGTTNNVLERQKFDSRTVSLGRAFDNDVILSDEHVDANHARLKVDEDGRLWLEDLGSVNGIRRPRHKAHIDRTQVRSGEVFLMGRSRVRIYLGTHPVAPAVRIRLSEVFLLWLGKPQVTVMLGLLFLAAKVLGTWLSTIGEFRWSQVIERNLGEVLTFLALAVGVYFLSVLFRRGGNFLAHLSLLILVFLLSSLLEFSVGVAFFNAGDRWYPTLEWLDAARGYLMLFVYLWSILYLAFHTPLMRRTLVSSVVVAAVIGVNNLPQDESVRNFVNQQTFPLKQKWLPPSLLLVQPREAAEFRDSLQELVETLADKRVEALADRDEDEDDGVGVASDPESAAPETAPEEAATVQRESNSGVGLGPASPGAE